MNEETTIPKDSSIVTAMTYASIEYDTLPVEVTGELSTIQSPFGGLPQCFVDGVQVDPGSVKSDTTSDPESEPPEIAPQGPSGGTQSVQGSTA